MVEGWRGCVRGLILSEVVGGLEFAITWMGLELEQERRPMVRPWKAPLKLRMERRGEPGAWWTSTDASSSSVKSVRPCRRLCMYLMNISLMPFSLLQVPHIMGKTWEVPGGATAIMDPRTRRTQSSEGNQPRAGLRSRCNKQTNSVKPTCWPWS